MEKIFEITRLNISLLENFPPQLQIVASGTVRTGGWSNPKLIPHIHIHAPPDGIYGFDFAADPPKGVAERVISPIEVTDLWADLPEGVKGVRVHAAQNSKTAVLDRTGQPDRRPDRFILSDSDTNTRIEFFPVTLKPSGEGQSADAKFEYHGPEGQLMFRGEDITHERTALGSLISVTLRPHTDAGGLDFTLVLPPVNLGGKGRQEFETVGIKIHGKRMMAPAGAELSYEVLHLKGIAEDIPIL